MNFKLHQSGRAITLLAAMTAIAGCSSGALDTDEGLDEDVGLVQSELRKGTPGAAVGQGNYCDDPAFPCAAGEGDCDSSTQCEPGLVCARNKVPQYQAGATGDACVPAHCTNKIRDVDETQIDCGGSCGTICSAPVCLPNGSSDRCTTDCPCSAGQGDCDASSECTSGLVCGRLKLKQFGIAGDFDACVPASCTNRVLDPGEEVVDCGGVCGSVCPGADPDRLVFLTSTVYTGNLGGLAGADAECQARAGAANLPGTYRAWLSSSGSSASARLSRGSAKYKLVGGTVIANTAAEFFSTNHLAPIDRDEFGMASGGEVWTGSHGNGAGSGSYCSNWTATSGTGTVGLAGATNNQWSNVYLQFCNRANVHLYCIQQ